MSPASSSHGPLDVRAGALANVPRLALSVAEACEALGVGWDFWAEHVAPDVRIVRRGRRRLVPVAELARWLDANAERALGCTGMAPPDASKSPANRGVRASRAPVEGLAPPSPRIAPAGGTTAGSDRSHGARRAP